MDYTGKSKITLDSKARIAIPTRYRDALLEQCAGKLMITLGPDDQALLLPMPVWEDIKAQLTDFDPGHPTRKRLVQNSEEVDMDSGGRVLLPSALRDRGLFPNASLVIVGNLSHFEVWDWDAHLAQEAAERESMREGWKVLRY